MITNLYILVDPDKPTKAKVGITKNPPQRLRAYRTAAPQCYYHRVYDGVDSKHEKKILELLKGRFCVDSEYVHCDPRLVESIVDGYFVDYDEMAQHGTIC